MKNLLSMSRWIGAVIIVAAVTYVSVRILNSIEQRSLVDQHNKQTTELVAEHDNERKLWAKRELDLNDSLTKMTASNKWAARQIRVFGDALEVERGKDKEFSYCWDYPLPDSLRYSSGSKD